MNEIISNILQVVSNIIRVIATMIIPGFFVLILIIWVFAEIISWINKVIPSSWKEAINIFINKCVIGIVYIYKAIKKLIINIFNIAFCIGTIIFLLWWAWGYILMILHFFFPHWLFKMLY